MSHHLRTITILASVTVGLISQGVSSTVLTHTHEQPDDDLRISIDLRDGSHLIARLPVDSEVALHTDFGKTKLPLKLVHEIQFHDDQETVKVIFHNGDTLSGVLEIHALNLNTSFGQVSIPPATMRRLELEAIRLRASEPSEAGPQKERVLSLLKRRLSSVRRGFRPRS